MSETEAREAMEQYKSERPDVDWDVNTVYALVNQETGEVERISHTRKDRIMGQIIHPEVGR